jgi:RHS repeat-associated protein
VGVVLDDTGAAAETVVRDAWGNLLAGSSSERYGFAQREHDSESGLVYMRARMYDPRLGRFTQMDPLLGNRPFEHYLYASNDPLMRTDPLGLDDDDDILDWFLMLFKPSTWTGAAQYVRDHPDRAKAAFKQGVVRPTVDAGEIATLGRLSMATVGWQGIRGFAGRNVILGGALAAEETAYRYVAHGESPTAQGFLIEAGTYAAFGGLVEGSMAVGKPLAGGLKSLAASRMNPLGWRPAPGLNVNFFGLPLRMEYAVPEARAMRIVTPREAGVVRAAGSQRHHVLTQVDEMFFMARGFEKGEIHKFTVELDTLTHQALHVRAPGMKPGGWWREELVARIEEREVFLKRVLGRDEVVEVAQEMLRRYNLGNLPFVPYR